VRDFDPTRSAGHRPKPARADGLVASPPAAARGGPIDAASVLGLQRLAGNASVVQLLRDEPGPRSPVHDVVGGGGGTPLEPGLRANMETAFGTSFGDVRVHTDDAASASADSVGANAYTVGTDIVFRRGQYQPDSSAGQRTLAHELAHVVQQSAGPVDGSEAPGGIRVSDPSDPFERAASATADQVVTSVQRQEDLDEAALEE
jgi:hypothetical protein